MQSIWKLRNPQENNEHHLQLGEKGCVAGYTCPTHVNKVNHNTKNTDSVNFHCKNAFVNCSEPKQPGEYCLMDSWCLKGEKHESDGRCKGTFCSIKLDGKWYAPYKGKCSVASDDCEPDTYCGNYDLGPLSIGTCEFGYK